MSAARPPEGARHRSSKSAGGPADEIRPPEGAWHRSSAVGIPATATLTIAQSELVVGGQKSGKSRRAQDLATCWLQGVASHRAVLIATAVAHDPDMLERIRRHRLDRELQEPRLASIEVPRELAAGIAANSRPDTLVVVDCLTLWLMNLVWPPGDADSDAQLADSGAATAALIDAIGRAPGPLVLVSNEIGLGVVPVGRASRAFVDALGGLNQAVARACARVTMMASGLPLVLKAPP